MSHNKVRTDNTCLNCGTTGLQDRYCPHCGQENVEPKQTLWHLITHFFNDVTHFDGKFFSTLKMLIIRPGFLSSEYVAGRRVKYLDPVRMYLFVSAVFLLFFLAILGESAPKEINIKKHSGYARAVDSLRKARYENNFNFYVEDVLADGDTESREATIYNLPENMRHGIEYYDSLQRVKPDTEKYNWLDRFMMKKAMNSYLAYDADPYNFAIRALDGFIHSISKISFISLPIFACLLFLLYFRRRKNYYYVSHAIFSLHYYVVMFLIILLCVGMPALIEQWIDISGFMGLAMFVILFVYLYIAMLRFYRQGWFKTLIKAILLYCFSLTIIIILALLLLINSFISMSMH